MVTHFIYYIIAYEQHNHHPTWLLSHISHLTLNICKIYKNTLFTYRYINIYCFVLHTHSFIFALHWKLKLSNISTFIYAFLHYYLSCSTPILFCITVMHEDLISYDCIVLIITVYSHNLYQKHINSIKLKNWFQPQFIFHLFIIHSQDWERECKAYYMVIHLSVFSCLHLYHITPKVFLRVQEEQGAFTVRFLMRI